MSNIAIKMSSMGFSHTYHFSYLCHRHFFYPFYKKLNQVAEKNSIVPWISPAIGTTVGMVNLIQIIGKFIEAILKGIGNLAVGVITSNTNLLKYAGLQLVVIPLVITMLVPILVPFCLFCNLILMTNLRLYPKETIKEKIEDTRYLYRNELKT